MNEISEDQRVAAEECLIKLTSLADQMFACCTGRSAHEIIGAAEILISWVKAFEVSSQYQQIETLQKLIPGIPYATPVPSRKERDLKQMNEWVKDELKD